MQSEKLTMELLSDTTFSANFGAAIDVDVEIDHDELGCPVVSGKTLRGLLRDTWLSLSHCFPELAAPADRVLGTVGDLEETGILRIGPATVDPTSHALLANAVRRNSGPTARMILLAFTTVRHQTAEDRLTGAPVSHSLRSSRA